MSSGISFLELLESCPQEKFTIFLLFGFAPLCGLISRILSEWLSHTIILACIFISLATEKAIYCRIGKTIVQSEVYSGNLRQQMPSCPEEAPSGKRVVEPDGSSPERVSEKKEKKNFKILRFLHQKVNGEKSIK